MWSDSPSLELTFPAMAGLAVAAYVLLMVAGIVAALILLTRGLRHPPPWKTLSETLRNRAWTWRDAGMILAIQLMLLSVAMIITSLMTSAIPAVLLIVETLFFDCAGLVFLWGYLKQRGISWTSAFGAPDMTLGRAFCMGGLFYITLLPVLVFSSVVYQGILAFNGYPTDLQDVALILADDQPLSIRIYMVILAVVLAPAFEECIFRGIALPLLARRWGVGPAVLIIALVFGLIHFHLPSFAPLCVVSSALSLAYLYSGSLWVPIIMHGLFNGVNVALLLVITP